LGVRKSFSVFGTRKSEKAVRYFEETSCGAALAVASGKEQDGANARLGILIHSVAKNTADIFLLLEQVGLDLRTGKELVRFQEVFQSHQACWPASDDRDLQNHFECDETLEALELEIKTDEHGNFLSENAAGSCAVSNSSSAVRMITASV
jgi:hypothetical protein